MTEFYNILDKIDLEEKEMLDRNASKKIGAAENLILDRASYIQLKYEIGLSEESSLNQYHGYEISVIDNYEEHIKFV